MYEVRYTETAEKHLKMLVISSYGHYDPKK